MHVFRSLLMQLCPEYQRFYVTAATWAQLPADKEIDILKKSWDIVNLWTRETLSRQMAQDMLLQPDKMGSKKGQVKRQPHWKNTRAICMICIWQISFLLVLHGRKIQFYVPRSLKKKIHFSRFFFSIQLTKTFICLKIYFWGQISFFIM